jgi:hypothetical protein
MRPAKISKLSAQQDEWMRRATDASIAAARDVVGDTGPIRPGTAIGRLAREEWGWIVSSVLWAWIGTRAEQAATEGWNPERTIGATGLNPDPRMAGAVAAILPKLAETCPELDWSKPVGDWPKEDIIEFLTVAFELIQQALGARDIVEDRVLGKVTNPDVIARNVNAAAGNALMTKDELNELNDSCPF